MTTPPAKHRSSLRSDVVTTVVNNLTVAGVFYGSALASSWIVGQLIAHSVLPIYLSPVSVP